MLWCKSIDGCTVLLLGLLVCLLTVTNTLGQESNFGSEEEEELAQIGGGSQGQSRPWFEPASKQDRPATNSADQQQQELVRVEYDNLIVESPFYDQRHGFTEAKRRFDGEFYAEIKRTVLHIARSVLVEDQSMFMFGLKNTRKIWADFKSWQENYFNFVQRDPSPRMSEAYCSMLVQLARSLVEGRSAQKLSGREAYAISESSLEALQKLIEASPTGSYLDWSQVKVNGQVLIEYYAPVVQHFRDSGRGLFLSLLRKLAESA